MNKYGTSLTFNYFHSEALRPDIYLFLGKWAEEEFFEREPVFTHVSFWMV